MMEISHYIDKDGNIVINASWDGNSFGAVLIPSRIIGGVSYIKRSCINTIGLDNPKVKKEDVISAITSQRGKYNETPLVVEDD